ncbi:hypothetical protein IGB42_03468 [Andreprevotia sp. IGB-42]|uniref:kelch repeat-containing protein n=1 Tax=Andreprevotia sp. IGB-42 TaxID=2497473 RepID=UPI001359196A|nr:kelch repeat-containing protein [Andreprevotia sp. IGB-42]KAF0812189.1 hypothetical protein IGB42_03468 [Andreprevotia sp. IGB-42]
MQTSFQLSARRGVAGMMLAALLAASGAQAAVSTGTLSVPRLSHQASVLADGRVLITGGEVSASTAPYSSVDMYDPAMGLFVPTSPMLQARAEHGAVTLADGRVLVVGGTIANSPSLLGTASAEIFDPATGQWTATGSMAVARARVLAQRLPDGRVFVISKDNTGAPAYAEVYDPQTGTFTPTGNQLVLTTLHGVVVLADGRVLKVGGVGNVGSGTTYLKRAEIWDPATNLWTATGDMNVARSEIKPVLLADGRVLVAGGRSSSSLASAEIYDPATGRFSAAPAMPEWVDPVNYVVTLPGGDVMLSGSFNNGLLRYNAQAGNWSVAGPKRLRVREGTATVLHDGSLLLAGGTEQLNASSFAELFEPTCQTRILEASPGSINLPSEGGSASLTVTGAPGCHFEVAGLPSWLQGGAPNPQVIQPDGTAAVGFATTGSNTTVTPLSASFTVGNIRVPVTQAASTSCTSQPTLSGTFSYSAAATSGTLNVNASDRCPWTLQGGMPAWFTISGPSSGVGNAVLNYSVATNTGAARSGGIAVSAQGIGNSYTLTQSAPGNCTTAPVLTPINVSLSSVGGSTTINVSAPSTCTWIASVPAWATLTSANSGNGNGSFTFSVPASTGARSASGSVQGPGVASTFNVSQAPGGTNCTPPTTQPINSGVTVNGNLQANTCSYGLRGSGYYTDRYSFTATPGNKVSIALSASAFDTYVYLLDPTGKQIAYNDDSGGSTNSRIPATSGTFTLPAGTAGSYSIQVTSYGNGNTGPYSLNLTVTP